MCSDFKTQSKQCCVKEIKQRSAINQKASSGNLKYNTPTIISTMILQWLSQTITHCNNMISPKRLKSNIELNELNWTELNLIGLNWSTVYMFIIMT